MDAALGVDRYAALSLDAPELAPFRQSIRERTLLRLLKADGLTTLGSVARLSRSELCDLPNIGAQIADDVLELLDRIFAGIPLIPRSPDADVARSDVGISPDTERQGDLDAVAEYSKRGSLPPTETQSGEDVRLGANSLGREFPGLALIASRRLSDPLLRAAWLELGDDLAHGWLARTGAVVVDELLGLTRQDLLDLRGLGPSKFQRLVDYLGRLADAAPAIAAWDDGAAASPEPDAPSARPSLDANLETVLAWATSVAGATTWGEALAVSTEAVPADVGEAWRALLTADLPSTVDVSPLAEFLADDPRRARILIGRVVSNERRTLQELASEFGVTRERMRQIESKGWERLRSNFASLATWRTVRWAAERVVAHAGAYAPSDVLAHVLPSWDPAERLLVARLAGYESIDPVLVRDGLKLPKVDELPMMADTDFVVDEFDLIERLQSFGVLECHIDFVLSSIPHVSRVDGQLVRWGGSVVDKAIAVLEVRDEPQDVDQLVIAAYGEGGSRSARNRILEDPRMMRVTKSKIGLRRWGGAHYRGVAELMLERLGSGPVDLDELADELAQRYEISPASVRMYAAAPAFKVTGEVIALRSRRDPYLPRDKPWKVRGLYRQRGVPVTVWCIAVDNDMLRGSGRSIPQEIASVLGLGPGDRTELTTTAGLIPVAWSETTHSGPQIGSIRELVVHAGVSVGEQVALRFDAVDRALEVRAISSRAKDDVVDDLVRLTTLARSFAADRTRLAEAVGTTASDLVAVLEARGDIEVASLAARLPVQAGGLAVHDGDQPSSRAAEGGEASNAVSLPGIVACGRLPVPSSDGEPGAAGGNRDVHPMPTGLGPDSDQATLEQEYERAVTDALVQMRSIGYDPSALRKLVTTVGPRRASELIAELAEPTEAFVTLYELGRLDLTVEAQMASGPYRDLFAPHLLSRITHRLVEHGFTLKG